MKNKLLIIMVVGLLGSAAQADLFSVTNVVNQIIPDNNSIGYVSTQNVTMTGNILTDIVVGLSISGLSGDPAFNGDYFITLQNDSGGYAVLVNRIGKTAADEFGYDDNGMDVTFSLAGADIHTLGAAPGDGTLTGDWGVDGRVTDPNSVLDSDARTAMLDSFVNPNGEWRLFVADLSGGGRGQLDSWSLDLQAIPEPGTLGLFVMSGGTILFFRRRWMAQSLERRLEEL